MADLDQEHPPDGDESDDQPADWVVIGVYGALGFEFVGAMLAGAWIGTYIDQRFGTYPYGLFITMLLMLLGVGVHIVHITRRLMNKGDRK
ncbi:MAG: AtpZ/AtpI family protein [Bradymonadaceae bacterium]